MGLLHECKSHVTLSIKHENEISIIVAASTTQHLEIDDQYAFAKYGRCEFNLTAYTCKRSGSLANNSFYIVIFMNSSSTVCRLWSNLSRCVKYPCDVLNSL